MSRVRTSPTPPHAEFFPRPRGAGGPARWAHLLIEEARQARRFWPVVQNMVSQELRVRYQRSVLGFFWTLLNPILMMATMAIVFSQILGVSERDYAVFLFSGMVPWTFLSGTINECSGCFIANEGLIRKIYLPKLVFPLSRVLINLTTCVLSMVALFAILGPIGARPSWAMLMLPGVLFLFTLFAMGLGLVVATANTFFRDCGHLIAVALQAWYFLTPIIYYPSRLSEAGLARLWINPAWPFIHMFQMIIRDGLWPDLPLMATGAGIAATTLGIGYVTFKCNEDKLVFRL